MLTQRAPALARFTRGDAVRLTVAAGSLIVALTLILAADILPSRSVQYSVGDVAAEDIISPKAVSLESNTLTDQARKAARAAVPFQYDYTSEKAIAIAAEQAQAFSERVRRVDTAFATEMKPAERASLLEVAIPGLSDRAQTTLLGLDAGRWAAVRAEAARILDATERTELRDTEVADTRTKIEGRMGGDLDEAERMLAAELIAPLPEFLVRSDANRPGP